MNIINTISRRDYGYGMKKNYDAAIQRLKSYNDDYFYGISPSTVSLDFNPTPPIFACKFCIKENHEHILALANEDGKMVLQDTNLPSNHTSLTGQQAHFNAIFDLAWMEGEMKLVTVSGDHTAELWDVGESEHIRLQRFVGHARSVKTVAFRPTDKAVFATGARDGLVMIWDTRAFHSSYKPDNVIHYCHATPIPGAKGQTSGKNRRLWYTPKKWSRAGSVTSLVFQDENHLITSGAGDGMINVWDLRKTYSGSRRNPMAKYQLPYAGNTSKKGFTNLLLDPSRIRLYASCMDDTIYCYNVSSYCSQPVARFTGHQNTTFFVKSCLSPDGQYLLSGSTDNCAYIWNTTQPGGGRPITALEGHSAEVMCVGWRPKGLPLVVTCSDDARHRVWRVEEREENGEDGCANIGRAVGVPPAEVIRDKAGDGTRQNDDNGSIQERQPREGIRVVETCIDQAGVLEHSVGDELSLCEVVQSNPGNTDCSSPLPIGDQEGCRDDEVPDASRCEAGPSNNVTPKRQVLSQVGGNECKRPCMDQPEFSSPTMNLPNHVLDGTSPHHVCSRSRIRSKDNWLTKLCLERTGGMSPSLGTPRRASARQQQDRKKRATLLEFFRVSGKSGTEQDCTVDQVDQVCPVDLDQLCL